MQEFIVQFNDWNDILDTLDKAGLTDPRESHSIHREWHIAKRTDNFRPLEYKLRKYPYILTTAIKRLKNMPFAPLPMQNELDLIQGDIHMGYINGFKDSAGINPMDLTKGMFICGEIGSGKSYPVLRMLGQILKTPIEKRGYNVLIIQILKRDADYLIEENKNLRVIEWEQLKRNIFEIEPWDDPAIKLNLSSSIFSAANYFMTKTQPIFNECINVCSKNRLQINFDDLFKNIGIAVNNIGYKGHEAKNLSDTVKSRLYEFKKKPQLNVRHGFRIDDFFSKEDICLNVVDEPNDYIYSTLITDILISLQRYYNSHPVTPKRLRTLIVIDECRSIFPYKTDAFDHNADRFLEKFITTRRSSGLGLINVTQEPGSVSNWLTSNSAFFLAFPISGKALKDVGMYQNLTEEQINHFAKLPPYGMGVFSDRRFDRPYLLQVPGDITPKDRTKTENIKDSNQIIKELNARIEKNKETTLEMEQKIKENRGNKPTPQQQQLFKDIITKYLDAIRENYIEKQFKHIRDITEDTQTNKFEKEILSYLTETNCLVTVQSLLSYSRIWENFPVLTVEGMDHLKIPQKKRINPDHFAHTYYCERISAWLEYKGLLPHREFYLKEKGKKISDSGRIDVFVNDTKDVLQKAKIIDFPGGGIAIEFTNTVTEQNILPNITKCLGKFKDYVDHILIVCDSQNNRDSAEQIITQGGKLTLDELSKVSFTTLFKFLEKI